MTVPDILGVVGVLLILLSLYFDFNLSAVMMEGSWALVSVAGLVRLALGRPRKLP
ncbi:MAG TPA: hypothetical protein VM348_06145 [Brevundimonas sp.]|nr:hypothetical protein [Brevundimonas sp.]